MHKLTTGCSAASFSLVGALLTGLLAACGSSGTPPTDHGFRFDISDYPGIVVLPLEAFREGRPTDAGDNTFVASPIIQRVRQGADTASDDPFIRDWDTMLGLASNGMGDDRHTTRFYLAYEVMSNPSSGMCTVTIHVIEGLPYDPMRAPLASYSASAMLGETHHDGFEIVTLAGCENEAAHRAAGVLLAAPHFDDGWSSGPPDHM